MKKVLAILLILGLTLGTYGVFSSSVSILDTVFNVLSSAQDLVFNIFPVENNPPSLNPGRSNSPFLKSYDIPDNNGGTFYQGDGYGLLSLILKNTITYEKWNIIGYETVIPDFSVDELKSSIISYNPCFYSFELLGYFSDLETPVYSGLYYSITFTDYIENAYLKAFQGETIYISSGSFGGRLSNVDILTRKGFVTSVKNPVFGYGPYSLNIKTRVKLPYTIPGGTDIVVYDMFNLVYSPDKKFEYMYPIVFSE